MKNAVLFSLLILLFFTGFSDATAQCMYRPVSLEDRIDHASGGIALGKMISSHCYWDANHENIYTLYRFRVEAWLTGGSATEIGIIAIGGFVGNDGQETYPTVHLYDFNDYILFLEGDNHGVDDRSLRISEPGLMQTLLYADQQGALTKQFGLYHDHMLAFQPMNEEAMFAYLETLTGSSFKTPNGAPYDAREYTPPPAPADKVNLPIVGFAPNPTNGGTIAAGDFITITGSGFGAAAGTVFYTNADDGGATFTATGVATDNTAWADASITNKPAPNAGTGPINVNGAMTSGSNLTINYGHTAINSTFSGFGSTTRQRYYHRNMNGAGGMYFLYNTTSGFSANAPAVAAFERALQTWRCLTFINWFSNGTTATGFAADGVNVVLFDGTLPAGVLGRATSRFNGSSNAGCTLANTVWCVNEVDVQFFTDPPTAGFPWEYGPAAPAFTEYDFESVAAHELGHAHGLQHRIAAGQTMNFAIANGASARTPNANEVTGGAVRMAYSSAATCFNPAAAICGNGPMTLLTAGTCILSVVITEFEGHHEAGKGNLLHWTTHSEDRNLGFFIERSTNGSEYTAIGFVPGNGTTAKPSSYDYIDDGNPLPGRAFYRLRQMDLDGNFGYTETVQIVLPSAPLAQTVYDAGSQEMIVNVVSPLGSCTFSLMDVSGRELMSLKLVNGEQRVLVSGLSAGAYLWRAQSGPQYADGKLLLGL